MRSALPLFVVLALAQSQPPSPNPPSIAQTQQDKTNREGVTKSERAPANPPNSGLFDKKDSKQNAGDRNSGGEKTKEPPNYEFLGARITDWLLALFTFFLAILGAFQWGPYESRPSL